MVVHLWDVVTSCDITDVGELHGTISVILIWSHKGRRVHGGEGDRGRWTGNKIPLE